VPNNTDNVLVIQGPSEDVKDFEKLMIRPVDGDGKESFDFSAIIPIPAAMSNIHCGSTTINGERVSSWRTDEDGNDIAIEESELAELQDRYGCTNAYNFAVNNWGTKWNAYCFNYLDGWNDSEEGRLEIEFQTAWSPPMGVYEKLAEVFPRLDITAYWSDEGSYERSIVYEHAGEEEE